MPGTMICRHCFVSGRVQGVFYRASTAQRARALGVTGYARNLADGRVEVLACGETQAVDQLCDWLREGPPAARVDAVEASELDCTEIPVGFITR
ncbi:MAG TPA: acylphosphatase [Gammaproteobacteria bacterium]|nr:acylphosphatase [Gammaproteobacteria bacterium]